MEALCGVRAGRKGQSCIAFVFPSTTKWDFSAKQNQFCGFQLCVGDSHVRRAVGALWQDSFRTKQRHSLRLILLALRASGSLHDNTFKASHIT